ncbi:50S ribosomal protein L11 methyltransferase [Desulfosarcina sp. OttesenSCG-928-A07]|nr:50S ribosomal protein L11 methyltransferase [Desulfosarcina sp. OttesenSCG-928-G17]MDL2328152.1 50S ribosomal protein L11 methyltransferase [Desulfosarcina sp. OttesenSCG-928-A07]
MGDAKEYHIHEHCRLELEEDEIFRVTPYSLFLAEYIPKCLDLTDKTRVLDFGTGCGIQALTAARCGAGQVYGVDIHPQALDLASRNQRRNSVHQFRTMNNHEPGWEARLEGEQVDYIVSNPASLPAPNALDATFWAGLNGHDMIEELIQTASRVLRPSGILLFVHTSLVNLHHTLLLLDAAGFAIKIVAIKKLGFRDFYLPLLPHWEQLRAQCFAYWTQEEGGCFELLYLISAGKNEL